MNFRLRRFSKNLLIIICNKNCLQFFLSVVEEEYSLNFPSSFSSYVYKLCSTPLNSRCWKIYIYFWPSCSLSYILLESLSFPLSVAKGSASTMTLLQRTLATHFAHGGPRAARTHFVTVKTLVVLVASSLGIIDDRFTLAPPYPYPFFLCHLHTKPITRLLLFIHKNYYH